jgi:hypothetical protein
MSSLRFVDPVLLPAALVMGCGGGSSAMSADETPNR